jgi:hypothetical protein
MKAVSLRQPGQIEATGNPCGLCERSSFPKTRRNVAICDRSSVRRKRGHGPVDRALRRSDTERGPKEVGAADACEASSISRASGEE